MSLSHFELVTGEGFEFSEQVLASVDSFAESSQEQIDALQAALDTARENENRLRRIYHDAYGVCKSDDTPENRKARDDAREAYVRAIAETDAAQDRLNEAKRAL